MYIRNNNNGKQVHVNGLDLTYKHENGDSIHLNNTIEYDDSSRIYQRGGNGWDKYIHAHGGIKSQGREESRLGTAQWNNLDMGENNYKHTTF